MDQTSVWRARHYLGRVGRVFLDLVYPPACAACQEAVGAVSGRVFCTSCQARIRPVGATVCVRCGYPLSANEPSPCRGCVLSPPPFHRARSWAYYATDNEERNPLARAICALKYDRRPEIGRALGNLLAETVPFAPGEHDLVVPVPLDACRLRQRGFNQACVLARPAARRLAVRLAVDAVRRVRPTRPQVSLRETERAGNLRGAFAVARPSELSGKRVLLVDDVLTTGATVRECTLVMLRAGATRVDVLTLARVTRW